MPRSPASAPSGASRASATDVDARRAARRSDLLERAVDAIRREGPGVSMETIAAEAGITKPIIYRHFGDRDGLIAAIGERFVIELFERLSVAFERDAPPEEMLAETIDAFVGLIERDTNVYRFLMQQGPVGGQQLLAALIAQQVASVLVERLGPDIDPAAATVWASGMVGMVHFAGDQWVERPTVSRDEIVRHLTTLLWHGLERIQDDAGGPR